jgi:hypothetical protein
MSGLGRAWVKKNVETARELLAERTDLTPDERDYLNMIIGDGEAFLRMTCEDHRDGTQESDRRQSIS